jgi:NADH dehydrogenase FAD-containing subunit
LIPHIVIVGCGFGGLSAARSLRDADVTVTLIDRSNHHLFQPLLYQVATAGLSAPLIAAPIRHIFRKQKNLTVLLADVTSIDRAQRTVLLEDSTAISYDYLIVAAGAGHSYFGPSSAPNAKRVRRGAKPGSRSRSLAPVPRGWSWRAPWRRSRSIRCRMNFAASIHAARASC